ncbi:MAG: NosR/NirI family protein [Gammaproteobacteria bacterium]|nr:NosR/NirI family protein [Gammaproteobacteria bacterium]MCW8840761.1 NosR/NirI family protein [Gammaproteobacteria bacterium]MCW8928586.1 NosR/NirI family protein [Gammaproteobacteria bacterium]MCW8958344.1 NosR/NirI family protein [Gammaproteobacteria bacterium]MCW8972604.1 NosR/NirI family protein [Gammaproteobacteria bacterium]
MATLWLVSGFAAANAATIDEQHPQVKAFFPQADRFGTIEGDPPAAPVYKGDEIIGYAFVSDDIVSIPAYSGKPVNMLMGISTEGKITGAKVLEHHEPILLVGIPEHKLFDFADTYVGRKVTERVKVGAGKREGFSNVDVITGATVTVIVVNRTIMRAAQRVAASRGIIKLGKRTRTRARAEVRLDRFNQADWTFLTGDGSIRRMLITQDQIDEAFRGTEAETPEGAEEANSICAPTAGGGERCDVFVDLYYAYLNAPTVGRNLLGEKEYNWLMAELKPGEHAIAIMSNGVYSFKGSGYVRGGIFDRIQVGQGDEVINFRDLDHYRLSDVYAEGMPDFREMGIFVVRENYGFDPGSEWSMSLLVHRATGPLDSVFTTFSGNYELPEAYLSRPEAPAVPDISESDDWPMWVAVWEERTFQIVVLGIGLSVLTLILVLQDWLVRFPRLITYLRTGFLFYTLFIIGWYMLGQLSVVNVLTFVNAVIKDFSWETFLIDPVMFILWSFVAVTLLLWGRGVYCGWLCPYGALQKLVNMGARKLKVPQWNVPTLVHERLWGIKYVILLVLFGIALGSMGTAERYAEVEPFKTAITLRFDREWPFILYAAGLVLISAFNAKFYCKYLCPLGAALAVPARLRLFNWLRRRKECGKPCQICSHECDIQAINDTGEINANECHYCLDCQVIYWDEKTCPPLIQRRKRREKAGRARESVRWMEKELGAEAGLEETKNRQQRDESGARE